MLEIDTDAVSEVKISTQTTTDSGRPDIEIRTSDCLIYVEVKDESGLGVRQLERYQLELNRSGFARTCLVLLTRYPMDRAAICDQVVQRRWIHIGTFLETQLKTNAISDASTYFLTTQFVEFLQFKGLAMAKVGTIEADVVRSLRNLCEMLAEAASRLDVSSKRSFYWPEMWMGLNLDGQTFSVGFYMESADLIEFLTGVYSVDRHAAQFEDFGKVVASELPEWTQGDWRWRNTLDLSANEGEFYKLTAGEQLQRIEGFLSNSLQTARSIGCKDESRPPSAN
ncbi:MAG: hypothetical protein DWQ34_26165 [Planctomycetota bacterium]|nr:MAG: hypothetical protein DWQ34_26165 [Planctomycetota bacterium]REJ88672.1 MAG: hypothetical protein DWQ29_08320 [Planctomycetota bacterium]REK20466.1 MAG: hypothetical protein DWQ41_25000 [Planctomycetota bacterium]REK33870.1 MAG: hypothetical protein DWQ45_14920 [Planctomycetota bacterium]